MGFFLKILCGVTALFLHVRFFTEFFFSSEQGTNDVILSMFIAILATILPMFEKVSQSRIKSTEGYIWSRFIMCNFKGALMILVFIVNGVANDFFGRSGESNLVGVNGWLEWPVWVGEPLVCYRVSCWSGSE